MSELLDIVEIKRYLPHRYPFLLLDRVTEFEPDVSIAGLKNVTVNEPFFNGHFPTMPVMPGVLIVEAMAQLSGILIFRTMGRYPKYDELFYLAGINNARFKRMVVPGDVLKLEVRLIRKGHGLWKFSGTASVDGELACSAEFMNMRGTEGEDA